MELGGTGRWAWRLIAATAVIALFLALAATNTSRAVPARQLQAPDQSTVPPTIATTTTTTTASPATTAAVTTTTTTVTSTTTTVASADPPTTTTTTTTTPAEVLSAIEEAGNADAVAAQPQLTG